MTTHSKETYTLPELTKLIASLLNRPAASISDVAPMKFGMTNKSWTFRHDGETCIIRIPGLGTDKLIDRRQECKVYETIRPFAISDTVLYFGEDSGIKISRFIDGARNCNPKNADDVAACIRRLRELHQMRLDVPYEFNLRERIFYYEQLRGNVPSVYPDYDQTRGKMEKLLDYVDSLEKDHVLCHIDSVADNLLISERNGKKNILLIDWEYAAMQDPHIDLAMFVVYSGLSRAEADHIVDIYCDGVCPAAIRQKFYAYIALCGFLWSNWCEFKAIRGEDFGDYATMQYGYAKDYYRIFREETAKN